METMQEEADTDTGTEILSSAEYANLESEGIALLTRQLQVNIALLVLAGNFLKNICIL